MEALRPTFPLSKGFFGDVQLSAADQATYRNIVNTQLQSALREEHEFVRLRKRQVDSTKWKYVSQKHQLQVYRLREHTGPSVDGSARSMLSVGKIEGTVEDLLFGLHGKNHEEMKISHSFVDVGCKDCTVLNAYETATEEDPFRSSAIKWQLSKFPVGRKRDWCYIEALGFNQDEQGERYGYLVLHSVERHECPPFHRKSAVRGQVAFTFIYRQISPGSIGVYSRGLFDPAGELIQQLSVIATASILTGIETTVKCAEAKKLTLLAMANPPSLPIRTESECFICHKGSTIRVSLRVCRVCHETVCSKCSFKKELFAGQCLAVSRVGCCTNCIVRAKSMKPRPAEVEFSIAALAAGARPMSVSNASLAPSYRSPPNSSTTSTEEDSVGDDLLTMDSARSRVGGSQSFMSVDGTMSEGDMEAIIAQVMSDSGRQSLHDHRKSLEILDDAEQQYEEAQQLALAIVPVRSQCQAWSESPSPEFATPPSSRNNSVASDHQEALYMQLLKLQVAAKQVYDTTLANGDLMHRM